MEPGEASRVFPYRVKLRLLLLRPLLSKALVAPSLASLAALSTLLLCPPAPPLFLCFSVTEFLMATPRSLSATARLFPRLSPLLLVL